MTSGTGGESAARPSVRAMKTLRIAIALLLVVFGSGCMHWANVDDLADVRGAARVRVEPAHGEAIVLDHPTVEQVRDLAVANHARVEVRKVSAWATTLLATGGFILTAFTALVVLGVASAGIAGG